MTSMPSRANRGYFGWVRVFAVLFLVLLFGAGQLGAQRGAITRLRNLSELVDRSAIILRGHVVSARVEPHPELRHLATLVVTLRVDEALKGQPGEVFTFRQFIPSSEIITYSATRSWARVTRTKTSPPQAIRPPGSFALGGSGSATSSQVTASVDL